MPYLHGGDIYGDASVEIDFQSTLRLLAFLLLFFRQLLPAGRRFCSTQTASAARSERRCQNTGQNSCPLRRMKKRIRQRKSRFLRLISSAEMGRLI